jgi:hypothetical protein
MGGDQDDAYDIYVLRLSGVPIFAGCTGSDYCTEHVKNHETHSAFLSAIYSFSKGLSADNRLKSIVFDTIQINMRVDERNDLMIVLVHPKEVAPEKIRQQIEAAHDLFLEKYKRRFERDASLSGEQIFKKFEKDLRERNILQRKFARSVLDEIATPMQTVRSRLAAAFKRED